LLHARIVLASGPCKHIRRGFVQSIPSSADSNDIYSRISRADTLAMGLLE
jgi:hypothetical protein